MQAVFVGAALVLLNLFAFILFGVDKSRAQRGAWRISERALLLSAACFGGTGALLGMRVFRHKTKHRAFTVSAPVAAAISIAAALYVTMM